MTDLRHIKLYKFYFPYHICRLPTHQSSQCCLTKQFNDYDELAGWASIQYNDQVIQG